MRGGLPTRRREAAIPLFLAAASFALAFAQRPGLATSDTKINLHVDPGRFLGDVASMWTSSGQLGDVQAGQQAGYLFPMGPFFTVGHALGASDWVVQRLWLGTVLALAAWGVVRLLDALLGQRRGIAQLAAGLVTLSNPFVVTYVNRTTVTLLAYAALPWLLLAVHRGQREAAAGGARAWRWPAAFALLVTASGGGINGAVTAWMLLGPALLLAYELAFAGVPWRDARGFVLRMAPLTVIASLWWVVPAWVQSSYGINFLHFTEQPGTIWGTTSVTESLRLMSFWLSYVGLGFAGQAIPYFDDSHTLLFSPAVVVATLLLPAAAFGGFVWTRRWRYGPFFLGLALVAVLVMVAGFPDGTPLRHGLTFTYNHVAALRFLRASYKAGPLLAVSLACLAGAAAGEALPRLRARPVAPAAGAAAGAAVLVLAAWPLVSGHAQDRQVSWKAIPAAWRQAARDLDRELPANSRAIVLPGDLFSFYTWGGTVDPILPALSRRPVAERTEVPYADLRATDLLWTIDGLVHQRRLLPGQLPPLLSLIGARAVVTGADDDLARSDAPPPVAIAAELAAQPGFARPARSYGRVASGLAEVRRYDLPSSRGLIRVQPAIAPVVVDGSAGALAGLAAFGALPSDRTLLYAGDLSAGQLRAALATGGELVISDSNRRQAFVAGSLERNTGPVLTADQSVSADGIMLDAFGRGSAGETVAVYDGIRSIQAPSSPQRPQFPEHRPFAAIDGSLQTEWLADSSLAPGQRWLQVDLERPTDIPYVDLYPSVGTAGAVRIAGRSYAVHAGTNRLAVGLRGVTSLRVYVVGIPGIAELRIPGVRAREQLRLPLDAAAALGAGDLAPAGLTYLFSRAPGEQTMQRGFPVPAARTFTADAWVTASRAGVSPAPCGSVRVLVGGASVPLRVKGDAAALQSRGPLRAVGCGAPVALGAGTRQLAVQPGPFAVDELRLRSPATRPLASVALAGGTVLDAGTAGRGTYDHVRVAVRGPSWLVLGEGYDRGWRAWCNGRSLGAPTPVDGYANGWRVDSTCHNVRFAFAPNRLAYVAYALSGLAALLCLALIALGLRRRRDAAVVEAAPAEIPPADHPGAWRPVRALLAAVTGGLAFGFVFGVAAGVAAVPALWLVLWRGVGARALMLVAAGLLAVVVPVLYLAHPGNSTGGNHFDYAAQHLGAHWVGVAAIGLLMAALGRTLRAAGRPGLPPRDVG